MTAKKHSAEHLRSLKQRTPLHELIGRYTKLIKNGSEWRGLCPFHTETNPSFTVFGKAGDQRYCCFGCGAKGDLFEWLKEYHGESFHNAVKRLEDQTGLQDLSVVVQKIESNEPEPVWTAIMPIPDDAPALLTQDGTCRVFNPKRVGTNKQWSTLRPTAIYTYRDREGLVLGYVLRCNFSDGKKFTPTITYQKNEDGEVRYCMLPFPEPRPLYGLEHIPDNDTTVYLVEGEKCVDALAGILPGLVVSTWPGGSNGVTKTDWSALNGHRVVIWPDNDASGSKALYGVQDPGKYRPGVLHAAIAAGATEVLAVIPPEGKPEGWDVADAIEEGMSREQIVEILEGAGVVHIEDFTEKQAEPLPEEAYYDASYENGPPADFYDGEYELLEQNAPRNDEPFRCLGYNRDKFYFIGRQGKQVLELTANKCAERASLLMLAPIQYWERKYPSKQGFSGMAVVLAANNLIQACQARGIFRMDRLRGRGAWWENNRAIVHAGDHLIVDNAEVGLDDIRSRFIYEADEPFGLDIRGPLGNESAHQLVEICENLMWERPVNAKLLAGFIALAPLCGALDWRPHIWITAPSGGGKSWVMDNIVRPCLGDFALVVQSTTTEAGIRQGLHRDARPVIFDEAEGENARSQENIDNVLALMRQASSQGGAILKGSTGGKVQAYDIKSMFAFSSIGVGIKQQADASRVSVLSLLKDNSMEAQTHFKQVLRPMVLETITPDWVKGLQARMLRMIPTIRKNIETFSEAASEQLHSKRIGDQVGTLLAGAYALHSDAEIDMATAKAFVLRQDWREHAELSMEREEMSLLQHILESTIRVEYVVKTGNYGDPQVRTETRGIGELIALVFRRENPFYTNTDKLPPDAASDSLERHGLKVEGDFLHISNTHKGMATLLRNTPWGNNWGRWLKRVDGADNSPNALRFKEVRSRAVSLPIGNIL